MTDLGFVAPDQYGGPDIICHRNASPVTQSAKVEAGGSVELQWTEWPESHHGPVIDYLANCHGSCSKVDKTSLKFNKIDEAGLESNSTIPWTVGRYASDTLIANGNRWTVTIPSYVAPGNYVLRHEIIALHSAFDPNGAQNYPQCINLEVTGKGTDDLSSGTPGESLYTADEPGILARIYQDINYIIPGPPLYKPGQVKSPLEPAKTSATVEGESIVSSSALPTFTSESSNATPTSASSVTPGIISASKSPNVSASPHVVASGNFSAPAASHYRSGSVTHSTGIASLTLAPTSISTPISQAPHPTVILNTLTSVQTATLQPTPSAGPENAPGSDEKPSTILTPENESEDSEEPEETEESSPPPPTAEESDDSTAESSDSNYAEDNQTSSHTQGSSPIESDTNTPTLPKHETPSHAPHDRHSDSTINDLLDLLEKTIKKLRKKLGKDRRHARDIVHHWTPSH